MNKKIKSLKKIESKREKQTRIGIMIEAEAQNEKLEKSRKKEQKKYIIIR